MLHALRSNTYYIRTKILVKNACSKLRPKQKHLSGYEAGFSPGTDVLPVIDNNLNVLSLAPRAKVHTTGMLHPSVHLLIFSLDRRHILIQARGSKKDLSAGKLAPPVAGHVGGNSDMVGQTLQKATIEETLLKEAFEEAGLENLNLEFIAQFDHQSGQGKNQEIAFLFATYDTGPVSANLSELKWLGWFSLDGIMKLTQKKPSLFAPSFLKDLEVLKKSEII